MQVGLYLDSMNRYFLEVGVMIDSTQHASFYDSYQVRDSQKFCEDSLAQAVSRSK